MDGEQRRINRAKTQFPTKLRALRAEQGLSRKELAEKLTTDSLTFSATSIASYENGRSWPRLEKCIRLCEVLDVTLEYLFGTGEREKFGVVEDFPNEEIAKLMEYLNKSGDLAKMIEALRTGGEAGLEEYMLGLEARLKAEMEIQAIEHAAFDIKPVQPLSLNALNLPIRAYNCLTRSGFRDAEEVAEAIRSDPKRMAKTRNLGRTSYQDIIDSLVKAGLLTKGEALPWSTIARLKGY